MWAARLSYVAREEGIHLTPDGAELLSRLADGALRDGLSLLDQCAAAGGTIDSAAVLEVLGLAGNLQTAQLMEHVLHRDAKAALLLFDQLLHRGKNSGGGAGRAFHTNPGPSAAAHRPRRGARPCCSGGYDTATLDRLEQDAAGTRLILSGIHPPKGNGGPLLRSNRRTDAELCLLRLCDESLCGDLTALESRIQRLEEAQVRGQVLRTAMEQSGTARPFQPPVSPEGPGGCPKGAPERPSRFRRHGKNCLPCRRSRLRGRSRESGYSTSRRSWPIKNRWPRQLRPRPRSRWGRSRRRQLRCWWAAAGGGRWRRAARAVCRRCTGRFWTCTRDAAEGQLTVYAPG